MDGWAIRRARDLLASLPEDGRREILNLNGIDNQYEINKADEIYSLRERTDAGDIRNCRSVNL